MASRPFASGASTFTTLSASGLAVTVRSRTAGLVTHGPSLMRRVFAATPDGEVLADVAAAAAEAQVGLRGEGLLEQGALARDVEVERALGEAGLAGGEAEGDEALEQLELEGVRATAGQQPGLAALRDAHAVVRAAPSTQVQLQLDRFGLDARHPRACVEEAEVLIAG